jgi:hypothetical protein
MLRTTAALYMLSAAFCSTGHAVELRVSSTALQRTLEQQLFSTPDGRHYIKGDPHSACSIYAESPAVHFEADRVFVRLHVTARLGQPLRGGCIGLHVARDVDVSLLPEAEGENIGFRDAKIERLSGSRELDLLLMPFLAHRVPSSLTVNAADQVRKILSASAEKTGYQVALETLKIHSMIVEGGELVVDVDGAVSVK